MVYIEEVVFENLFVNGVLLVIALAVLNEKRVVGRILLSAALGTVFAVFLPFIEKDVIPYKLAALVATTLFAAKHRGVKRYLLFVLTFAAVSFAAGGAAYGLNGLAVGKNGTLSFSVEKSVKFAVYGALLFLWVVLRQIRLFTVRRRISASKGALAKVYINDDSFEVLCLNDTGNSLVDVVTQKPVTVLSHDVGAHYIQAGAREISVNTVNCVKNLPVITADKLTFTTASGERVFEKMPIAVSDTTFDGYKLIVNFEAF